MPFTRRAVLAALAGKIAAAQSSTEPAWIPMFDGHSLAGWREVPFPAKGEVAIKDDTIQLGKGRMTGIVLAEGHAFPRTGYEIRFEAARLEGHDFFAGLTFPVKDTHCTWINGGWDGTVVGLSNIDDYDASENDTSTTRDFVKGRWYTFRLAVTDSRIQAWIDGATVIDTDITRRRVSLRFDDIDLCIPLGFASYATVAGLRKIEYRLLAAAPR